MPPGKMTGDEVANYFERVHRMATASESKEALDAVIRPGGLSWVNRFVDYAHRLGMERAFSHLDHEWGSLKGRSVLDLGCGVGRWAREYARRGASVTGIDLSEYAVRTLRRQMPQHTFLVQDLRNPKLPSSKFDLINSVTVIQHMTPDDQKTLLRASRDCLKEDGYLILLENISDFQCPHVFAHTAEEWARLAAAAGFRLHAQWGSNYEVLFKVTMRLAAPLLGRGTNRLGGNGELRASARRGLRAKGLSILKSSVALTSYPVEWFCHMVSFPKPTHAVMIFRV